MKTIRQEAQDWVEKESITKNINEAERAFRAGFAFAEEWIKVDDELPSEENCYIEEEVLVRDSDKVSAVAIYRLEEYWESFDERIGVVKEWRPLHRK